MIERILLSANLNLSMRYPPELATSSPEATPVRASPTPDPMEPFRRDRLDLFLFFLLFDRLRKPRFFRSVSSALSFSLSALLAWIVLARSMAAKHIGNCLKSETLHET